MSQNRLYIDQPIVADTELEITGDRAHYLGRVLRMRVDQPLIVFDGSGGEYPAHIASISKRSVRVSVGAYSDIDRESPLSIHLLQGLSRGDRMDTIVQKTTELGVAAITPLTTDFSVVKILGNRAQKKLSHWRGISISACEQCGRNVLPRIDEPTPFKEWLGVNVGDTRSRLILKPDVSQTLDTCTELSGTICVLIGPEGGFSDVEYKLAEDLGFEAISLGPRILRTETAAIATVAGLQSLFGDSSSQPAT